MSSRVHFLIFTLVLSLTSQGFAQRDLKKIPPPDPKLEQETFILAEGFEVNLYAADPLLAKPIQMNFDERGRLWVASSEVYPQIEPGQEATDKILILEDTDLDGVAEKTSVFADGLLIPTGVIPGDGGAYVANSTELLHMSDNDGDGKADRTRVILSGFGTEDTHHILHTLRWGPDGLLYFNQSIYIHSHLETPYGVKRLNGGGIWQFRPETMEAEVFMRGLVNSWGHHFDKYGQSFATDGAGGEGINYIIPRAYYFTAVGADRIVRGLNPGSPKHCGLEIVSGRHLPEDWQGTMVTNDFRGHRVCRFKVTDDGAGFASREQEEVIKSDHVAFRPIDVKMGPDGAIYIADWYNPIIQHGEVDFRDPRRDHTHGRIWRVTRKGAPLVAPPKLAEASTGELLDFLKSPEEFTRTHAKRLLRERHLEAGILSSLNAWVSQLDPNHPEFERHLLEGLWTYQAANTPDRRLLERCLVSETPEVRAAAVRVLGAWRNRINDPLDLLAEAVGDEYPRVRLEAVRALGQIPQARSFEIALNALDKPVDQYLDYSLWLTARELRDVWLPELQAGRLNFNGNPAHLIFAYQTLGQSVSVKPLVDLLDSEKLSPKQREDIQSAIASLGQPQDLALLLASVKADATPVARKVSLLESLIDAAENRNVKPNGSLDAVTEWLNSDEASLQQAAARAAGSWKLESTRAALQTLAQSGQSDETRIAAIDGLRRLGGNLQPVLVPIARQSEAPLSVREAAITALASSAAGKTAELAVEFWQSDSDEVPVEGIMNVLLRQKNGPGALLNAVSEATLPGDTAKRALRVISASGRKFPQLEQGLAKAGKIKAGPVVLSPEEINRMVTLVTEKGDPAQGEQIFRRESISCFKCHAIGGAGGKVGPDLISLGASAQVDYIIESLLNPNAKVKENYHTVIVVTDEGKTYSGIKLRQTDRELVLRDAEDKEIRIALDAIEEQADGASIMPAGLTEKLTEEELVHLVSFLSELGKLGDYAVVKTPLARKWQVLIPDNDSRYQLRRKGFGVTATSAPELTWKTEYAQVNGSLPYEDMLNYNFGSKPGRGGVKPIRSQDAMAFVRTEVNVSSAGTAELIFDSPEGLTLWVDEIPTEVAPSIKLDLEPGVHRISLAVNLSERGPHPLKLMLGESTAQLQFVNGK
ncbi:MAG: HEAT repeat domain-containing protein [Planctomycetaceae bacterium]|nr:HEAT repeat domain-containing protein [Planctomycetaceae bacterium]